MIFLRNIVKSFIIAHLPIENLTKGFSSGTSNLHNFYDFQPIFNFFLQMTAKF